MPETLDPVSETPTSDSTTISEPQPVLVALSTLTDRYQTTVPDPVRKALGIGKRDKIAYAINTDGNVYITKANTDDGNDPIVEKFLAFIDKGIEENPQRLIPVTAEWAEELKALVAGVDVDDLSQPLSGDDE